MTNETELRVLDTISDIEDEVNEKYRKDEELAAFLKLFGDAMEGLEMAVTLHMADNHLKKYGLDITTVLADAAGIRRNIADSEKEPGDKSKKGEGQKLEESPAAVRSSAFGSDTAEINKKLEELGEMCPRIISYTPGYGPAYGPEPLIMRAFNLKDQGVRELRFAETDFLICFHEGDVERTWDRYYLSGPAAIYAVDKKEHIRSLTDAEIMKIISVCLHKEEGFEKDGKSRVVFRLC